ncbi:MAG TPA: SPOR domain-containing protein [Tepidisphaeraceae bacterium]|nr:SPOR domain-containing protein [Tepidisphaeraceae bacterium]
MRNAGWILLAAWLAGCASSKSVEDKKVLGAGYQSLNAQDYDAAMQRSEEFLQNNPNGGPGTPEALYLQGRVYEHRAIQADNAGKSAEARSDLQDARTTYEHALTLKPSPKLSALLRAGMANAAYFQEDYYTAMREWAAAYPELTDPDAKAWVLYRLGLCQQRLGRFDEADRSFAQVRQQFPRSEPAQRASHHEGAKAFYVQVGSFADAKNADAAMNSLRTQGFNAIKSPDASGRQSIRVGPAFNYEQAKALKARVSAAYPAAIIEP